MMSINAVLGLLGALGLGSIYVLFQRLKNAWLNQQVSNDTGKEQQVNQQIAQQNQTIEDLTKQVQGDIKAYEDAKNNPGSQSNH